MAVAGGRWDHLVCGGRVVIQVSAFVALASCKLDQQALKSWSSNEESVWHM